MSITYILGLDLSNKYLEVIIKFQKPKILEDKVKLLFGNYRTLPRIPLLKSEVLDILWGFHIIYMKELCPSQFVSSLNGLDYPCFIRFT